MFLSPRFGWRVALVVAVAILGALWLGVHLRLEDPLSTQTIPAEDPYTHMVLVREHLADGTLDPMHEGGSLYPPGMHAFVAAAIVYTGIDLYDITRLGPVLFGAIGIIGIALVLLRHEGPVAAIVGAFAFAVAPEVIHRTTMMAPTAFDMALIPFLLFCLLELLAGRLAWAWPTAVLTALLLFAHPWFLTILVLALAAFSLLAVIAPWPRETAPPIHPIGLALAVGTAGVAWGISLMGCWGACGPGFRDIIEGGSQLSALGPLIVGLSLLLAAFFAWQPPFLRRLLERPEDPRRHALWRTAASCALALLLTAITIPAVAQGLPDLVDLVRMFGIPILALAALGTLLLPFVRSPVIHVGAALVLTTYPFVIYNPLDSPFWPHRTAVFMGIGLVLVAASATAIVARFLHVLVARHVAHRSVRAPEPTRRLAVAAPAAALVVAIALTGTVVAATPDPYEEGWYRLFDDCEMDGIQTAIDAANADPDLRVITGDWQSKLVVAAYTPNASRIWYKNDFFTSNAERNSVMHDAQQNGIPLVALIDRYTFELTPGADTQVFENPPWQRLGAWCEHRATNETLRAYRLDPGDTP